MPIWRGQRLVVVVAEHAALRRAGRAAGVDERGRGPTAATSTSGAPSSAASSSSHAMRPSPPATPAHAGRRVVDDDHVVERSGRSPTHRRRPDRRASRLRRSATRAPESRELVAEVLALVGGVDRHGDRHRPGSRPTRPAVASGEFSIRLATRSPGRTPSSRSALASWLAVAFTSAAVNVVPHTSRYWLSGSSARRRSSSAVIVCCSPLIQD